MLVTISDRRLATDDGNGEIAWYDADVVTANDYYPFGMGMPGRKYSADGAYRYGFNGKENDNEVEGEGNQQDYGMRIYDPRLGRFLSVDPLTVTFPWYTPFQFGGNTPIQAIDLDGAEPFYMAERGFNIRWYYSVFNPVSSGSQFWDRPMISYFSTSKLDKFGADAVDRLRAFATDNNAQYKIHRSTGVDNKVYFNSKKLGYYDCVTAQEASLQIVTNNFSIKLAKGGNAAESGRQWEKQGIVGSPITFSAAKASNLKKGDASKIEDFKLDYSAALNLENLAGQGVGTTFFTFEMGHDFHGGIAGVIKKKDNEGVIQTTFFYADQLVGYVEFSVPELFDRKIENFLYLNSTSKNSAGERVYDPGQGGSAIAEGNAKVTFRKVKRQN